MLVAFILPAMAEPAPAFDPRTKGLATYVTDSDYPKSALRERRQGDVHFTIRVSRRGRVIGCTIDKSSGHADLDARTCKIMRERPRFTPARDERGKPTEDQVSSKISWRIYL